MNEKGLYQKYTIQKTNGEPLDPEAKYIVLRYDHKTDEANFFAAIEALRVYAKEIEKGLPAFSNQLLLDIIDETIIYYDKLDKNTEK